MGSEPLHPLGSAFGNESFNCRRGATKSIWMPAMMTAYAKQYPTEEFEVIALARCRGSILALWVNKANKKARQCLEHKTASQIDASYLERLWMDFQITLYAYYLEQSLGIKITGIIYNVLVKAKLKQGKGETEAEYEIRLAGLIAKSKTGKSSAKRKMPETDDEFQLRLLEKYSAPGLFHREMLYISRDQFTELRTELWELTKALLDARRRNVFYRNTSYCFQYNRACSYLPLCQSGGNPNIIENHYQQVEPHEELRERDVPSNKALRCRAEDKVF